MPISKRKKISKALVAAAKRYLKRQGKGVKTTIKNIGKVARYYAAGGEYGLRQNIRLAEAEIRRIKEHKRMFGRASKPRINLLGRRKKKRK